ncbi:hypothetical protein SAMN02927937_02627 [Paenimyroides aquimaris]|uniref:Glyoxalase n=1 Tax=Paenimyroides marinum TaxID=1159016 RepID=A0A1H6MDR9_9FLAO|nr:hypothetical protein [Paenimyroides aquimaris]SEH99672.1 hypothetical protein SAMN02927937_02627 [Paenimyroides aquimaris]
MAFYEQLGFKLTELQTSPNPYAALQFGTIELHFWGNRRNVPAENASMCFIRVNDVDALHDAFAKSIKKHTGKVPRSGIPRFTTVRDLKQDRRFTLTDAGGNTLFIGTPISKGESAFYRTLENEKYAKLFAVLYDVVYSKEDPEMAADNLSRCGIDKSLLNDLDKAKYLLTVLDIQNKTRQDMNDTELKNLIETHKDSNNDWKKIKEKYFTILKGQ